MQASEMIKILRERTGLNRKEFSLHFRIPLRTVEDWEAGRRTPPEYLPILLEYQIKYEELRKDNDSTKIGSARRNVNVILDEDGRSIVLINDVRFKSRRTIDWEQVEECLKEYIGNCYEILETSEMVYIGADFPDEFCHSEDKIKLKGANEKAKANMVSAIGELIKVATNKTASEDFDKKHRSKAKYGWYRYDIRFGIPSYNSDGELERYNIYSARMLVRCDEDGKLYLYDLVRTKKETSSPSE